MSTDTVFGQAVNVGLESTYLHSMIDSRFFQSFYILPMVISES